MVEKSSFPLIALFWLKIGRCRGRNWLYGNQASPFSGRGLLEVQQLHVNKKNRCRLPLDNFYSLKNVTSSLGEKVWLFSVIASKSLRTYLLYLTISEQDSNLRMSEYMLQSRESSWGFPSILNLLLSNVKRSSAEQIITK